MRKTIYLFAIIPLLLGFASCSNDAVTEIHAYMNKPKDAVITIMDAKGWEKEVSKKDSSTHSQTIQYTKTIENNGFSQIYTLDCFNDTIRGVSFGHVYALNKENSDSVLEKSTKTYLEWESKLHGYIDNSSCEALLFLSENQHKYTNRDEYIKELNKERKNVRLTSVKYSNSNLIGKEIFMSDIYFGAVLTLVSFENPNFNLSLKNKSSQSIDKILAN